MLYNQLSNWLVGSCLEQPGLSLVSISIDMEKAPAFCFNSRRWM